MRLTTSPIKRQQVIDGILQNIQRGDLAPGMRLATVQSMSKYFNVSTSVIQTALRELTEGGHVECCGSKGYFVRDSKMVPTETQEPSPTQATEPAAEAATGQVFLACHHHSDLVWKKTFEGYAEVRERQIRALLDFFTRHKHLRVLFDQSEVVRVYLKNNPQDLPRFQELVKAGAIELAGGLCIPDTNLVSGESLLRNVLAGQRYYAETFGVETEVASLIDAFGLSAQLPQILQLAGMKYLIADRLPNRPADLSSEKPFRWQGLDGSVVTLARPMAISHEGYVTNVPVMYPPTYRLGQCVASLKHLPGHVLAFYMTEVRDLLEDVFWIVDAANRSGGKQVTFGRIDAFFKQVASGRLPVCSDEFNPIFTGCYTTRITVKQRMRQAESRLEEAEFLAAVAGGQSPLAASWQDLFLAQFHDAICGCHTDEAFDQIMGKLDGVVAESENTIAESLGKIAGDRSAIFHPSPTEGPVLVTSDHVPEGVVSQSDGERTWFVADLPPWGVRFFNPSDKRPEAEREGSAIFSTEHFDVDFSRPDPVIRSRTGNNVFPEAGFGEILLRQDMGSMWREDFKDGYEQHRPRLREEVVSVTEGPVLVRVVTQGEFLPMEPPFGNVGTNWPSGFEFLRFTKTYLFPRALDHFRLRLTLDFAGLNTKVAIRFPLRVDPLYASATYDIPFGSLIRKPYFEVPQTFEATFQELRQPGDYGLARGDWPALNWVDYGDHRARLAVANTGTPGHQLVGENIFVSLLRSPTECADGGVVPQAGAHDNGVRTYDFAFCSHRPQEMEKAYQLGRLLNHPSRVWHGGSEASAPETVSWLAWDAPNVALSAMFPSEEGVVLRLYETLGRSSEVTLSGELARRPLLTADASGRPGQALSPEKIRFKPFEIRTFVLQGSSSSGRRNAP